MTIPAEITVAGLAMSPVYSGSLDTSRRTNTGADGITRTIDIIQSVPNKNGRWRHVVRFTMSRAPDVNGKRVSFTNTVTMDAPADIPTGDVADVLRSFLVSMDPLWDEVAAGQQ